MVSNGFQEEDKRVRTLKTKALEEYNQIVQKYQEKLCLLKRNVDYEIGMHESEEHMTVDTLSVCKNRVNCALTKYCNLAKEYEQFLERTYTEQSLNELQSLKFIWRALEDSAYCVLKEIEECKQNLMERLSHDDVSRANSAKTTSTSYSSKMRAKAEAAKAALEFAAQEAQLKRAEAEVSLKRTNIQTDLELLGKKREAAVAIAEYNAVKEELESQGLDSLPRENNIERTRQYVNSMDNVSTQLHNMADNSSSHGGIHVNDNQYHDTLTNMNQQSTSQPTFLNTANLNSRCNEQPNKATLSELSRFLLKKDLLMSRFAKFTDKPESYEMWKASFQAITKELEVSALEESELLIKYLGPVIQIRSKYQDV